MPVTLARPAVSVKRSRVNRVGAGGHENAVGHVDDAHLAENDRESERHQQQHAEEAQAWEKPCMVNMESFCGGVGEHHLVGLVFGCFTWRRPALACVLGETDRLHLRW